MKSLTLSRAVALVIMTLYVLVGREVWRRRRRLTALHKSDHLLEHSTNFPLTHRIRCTKTTEVNVISEPADTLYYPNYHTGRVAEDEERLRGDANVTANSSFDIRDTHCLTTTDFKAFPVDAPPEAYSVVVSTRSPTHQPTYSARPPNQHQRDNHNASALFTYIRTSLLFFVVLIITWVPSSLNRVYSLVYPDRPPNYPLSLLSSIVLPLQGFWNAVVFTVMGIRGWEVKSIKGLAKLASRFDTKRVIK
jgi:hypothetical protein